MALGMYPNFTLRVLWKCGNNFQGLWFNNRIHVRISEFARKSCYSGCWKINDSNHGALRPLAWQISRLVNAEGPSRCWYTKSVERVRKTALVIARSLPITPDLLVVELGGFQSMFWSNIAPLIHTMKRRFSTTFSTRSMCLKKNWLILTPISRPSSIPSTQLTQDSTWYLLAVLNSYLMLLTMSHGPQRKRFATKVYGLPGMSPAWNSTVSKMQTVWMPLVLSVRLFLVFTPNLPEILCVLNS